jgi:hypothetical protein
MGMEQNLGWRLRYGKKPGISGRAWEYSQDQLSNPAGHFKESYQA